MPIMEISIVPVGTKTTSVGSYVASCIKVLRKEKKIKFELTSMGTIVEAKSLEELFRIAAKMHTHVLSCGAKRVVTTIKIDDRLDKNLSIQGKVKAVKQKLSLHNL